MRLAVVLLVSFVVPCLPRPISAQTRPATIDDVLDLRAVGTPFSGGAPAIAPDGSAVLFTVRAWHERTDRGAVRKDARTHVWRVAADASGPARQITFGERGDSQPAWSPDGRYMSFLSARGPQGDEEPKVRLWLMRADGGEAAAVTDGAESVQQYAWSPDAKTIAFTMTDPRSADEAAAVRARDDERPFEAEYRRVHLWVVDVASRRLSRVTSGAEFTINGPLSWSPDNVHVAFAGWTTPLLRDGRRDIYVADTRATTVEKISTNFGPDSGPRYSPDGRSLAYLAELVTAPPIGDGTPRGTVGQSHVLVYDVASRQTRDATGSLAVDPGPLHWSADSRRLLFSTGDRAYTNAFELDVASGRAVALTRERTLQIGSFSADGSRVAFTMDSPTAPAEVFVADARFSAPVKLTDLNPQIRDLALGATEVVTWKSRDGLDVEGVLLKPVGYDPSKRYPLLVVAHGGPAGAHVNNFRVGGLEGGQVWAGMGWAVFYPNPRGSSNYGEKFLRANVADWGGGDFADIDSGVDALVARGLADPDRLAHIGWSYGGYMTAWTITQTRRYKAAMVGAGLTNLWSMYGTNDIPSVLIGYFGGIADKETLPLYMNRSAMTHIDNATTPTLILHGGSDERVPIGQAQELFRGLKDRGRTTELVVYPREGHGITEYYHQQDRLIRIRDWVTTHVTGDGRPSSPPRQ
ncbi:MAG: prolyl oligopeptidase family serine peptidase [Vicinamibacterales bacterium]